MDLDTGWVSCVNYPDFRKLQEKVKDMEKQIAMLMRGGCQCDKPDWYYAALMGGLYRCARCGATVSPALVPEAIKRAADNRHGTHLAQPTHP